MTIRLNATAPDFDADTTDGPIRFHEWIGDGWALLFSHPKDFTPVCTTEMDAIAERKHEFDQRNCKVIGISANGVDDHLRWSEDIRAFRGRALNFPLIGDPTLRIAKAYDLLPADADGSSERTAADNATVRTVYIIGPDKRIKAMLTYPMTTGRDVTELLRVLDSVQLTAAAQVATPAGWRQGEDVIIVPSVSDDDAAERYPHGWDAPLPYLRLVKHPT